MSMVPLFPEDDPLYGDTATSALRMVPECRAFVVARRHLFHDHAVSRDQLRENRSMVILHWHLQAHGLPADTPFDPIAIPWGLVSVVHRLAAEGTTAAVIGLGKDRF
jgi:hypothetical protein